MKLGKKEPFSHWEWGWYSAPKTQSENHWRYCLFLALLPSSSVGTGFINECVCFRENFVHVGQQSKIYVVFTAEIIQYLQIKLCMTVSKTNIYISDQNHKLS